MFTSWRDSNWNILFSLAKPKLCPKKGIHPFDITICMSLWIPDYTQNPFKSVSSENRKYNEDRY